MGEGSQVWAVEFGIRAKFSTGAYPNTSTTAYRNACAYPNTSTTAYRNACAYPNTSALTHSNSVVAYADT